jgi:subtilisin family serine protease
VVPWSGPGPPTPLRRRFLGLAVLLVSLLLVGPRLDLSSGDAEPTGRVVVRFLPEWAPVEARAAQEAYGALAVLDRDALGAQVWLVPSGRESDVAGWLSERPDVDYAEPDVSVRALAVPNDPNYLTDQWNLPMVRAAEAWEITPGRPETTVAVIDSGIDPTHPDGPGTLALGCDHVAWRGQGYAGSCPTVAGDPEGHGTHVAGIVAARQNNALYVSGLAPGVRVIAIRVLDAHGSGYGSDVAAGVVEAVRAGASVINLSLGGPSPSSPLQEAIAEANRAGVVVVAAAGNSYENGNPLLYPAALPGVVAVGALSADSQHAYYSSSGAHLSIAAPGGNGQAGRLLPPTRNFVTSLYPVSKGSVRQMVGTSMAAPHVAAAAGLMRSVRPDLGGGVIADLLRATAAPLGSPIPNILFGYGRLDAAAAVRAARAYDGAPAPAPTPREPGIPTATPRPPAPPPTRAATATPLPGQLWRDDFRGPDRGWTIGTTTQGVARYAIGDGRLDFTMLLPNWTTWLVAPVSPPTRDVAVEADVVVVGAHTREVGLLAGYSPSGSRSRYVFALAPTGRYAVLWRSSQSAGLVELARGPAVLEDGRSHHLRLVRRGARLEGMVDGAIAVVAEDASLAGTGVGLYLASERNSIAARAFFADFAVARADTSTAPTPTAPAGSPTGSRTPTTTRTPTRAATTTPTHATTATPTVGSPAPTRVPAGPTPAAPPSGSVRTWLPIAPRAVAP